MVNPALHVPSNTFFKLTFASVKNLKYYFTLSHTIAYNVEFANSVPNKPCYSRFARDFKK